VKIVQQNGNRLLVEGKLLILYNCQLRTVGEDLSFFQNLLSGMLHAAVRECQ
jgi:hypothetical protein